MKQLVSVVLGLLLSLQQALSMSDVRSNCKPVTASFCQGVGYTTTLYPGGVSGFTLQQIGQIVETACSPDVATVMCRVVVPECSSVDVSRLKPCKALCEKVQTDCESTLKAKRLLWPATLRCDALPESNCVQVGTNNETMEGCRQFIAASKFLFKFSFVCVTLSLNVHYVCYISSLP